MSLVVAVVVAGCGPYPPATRCEYSFSPGRCMTRANQTDKPLVAQDMPAETLDRPAPSAVPPDAAAPAPCAAPDVLVAAVVAQVHGAASCAGVEVTPGPGGDVDVTAEHADLTGCLDDPAVHAALAELQRCLPPARAN